jgi:hypothetical protein
VWGAGNEGVIKRIQRLPESDMAELMRCIEEVRLMTVMYRADGWSGHFDDASR